MQLAATRGKMMEILSRIDNNKDRGYQEQAFMTGIFSLLETLIGQPIKEIIEQLHLPDAIRGALLERSGTLGKLLTLCEELEKGDFAAVEKILAELPGLSANDVTEAQLAAARWVASLGEPGS